MIIQVGKAGFNLKQLTESKITTLKAFKKAFAGTLDTDIDKAWKKVEKGLKKFNKKA